MRPTRVLAGLAVAALLPATVAAEGDDAVATVAFESLDVSVVDGEVVVEGVASYGGEEIVVAEDATGDAMSAGAGHDLAAGALSQDPDSGELVFRLAVADMAAGLSNPGTVWGWPIGGSGLEEPQLLAFSTDENGAPGFQFFLGTGGGINETFSVAPVSGEFDGEALVWRVTPSQIGISEGGKVSPSAAVYVSYGVSAVGATTLNSAPFWDDMPVTEKFGIGGGAEITILDSAGEEVDEVDARVRRGQFGATIGGLEPGTYSVVVTTRYADAEASEVFTVVI